MYSGKVPNTDFEKYSFSDVDLQVTWVKTSAALNSSGPGICEKQGEGNTADQAFCQVASDK